LLAACALAATAANFSGKWALSSAGGRGGGRGGPTILQLSQSGSDVTGTITLRIDAGSNAPVNMEIFGGKADGDTLAFYVWTGTDQPAKTVYRGTMSGDEIAFTFAGGATAGGFGGPVPGRGAAGASDGQAPAVARGGPQQMTAKRVK